MSITDRDKKILVVVVLIAALAGYWFLLLSPKRAEVAKVEEEVAAQQEQRDAALAQVQSVEAAQASFESDYAEMVRLGKAIPSSVDMPSLLVQLDSAAGGNHIDVDKITVGARVPASGAAPAPAPAPPAEGEEGAAEPGGEEASSAPGQAAEGAAENGEQLDTQTSKSARDGSVPVGGGGAAPAAAGGAGVAGLDSVPIDFEFRGSFFDLADFFHELKRFVHLGEDGIVVRGRLMTIDNFSFGLNEGEQRSGELKATVRATVYLAPKAEGATAGATPSGPAPQGDSTTAAAPTPPTATVQP